MIPEAMQAAAEVAHQAPTWPAVAMAAVAAMGSWLAIIYGRNQARKTNGGAVKPGESRTCREHGEDISSLLEFKDGAKESLTRIEGKVDRLLERAGK